MAKPLFAAWQQLPSLHSTLAMASAGFDWIVVDLEHTTITTQETEAIFIATERGGAKPFARLPSADPYLARRLLDAGAFGLFIPVVESREAFDDFAQHCFYPPKGRRGLGLVRANGWGDNLEGYFKDFKPILIAQIETKKGADNVKEITASPFLDGIMIGPYDLSANIGIPGQFDDEEFKKLCNSIMSQSRENHKMVGTHQVQPIESELKNRVEQGYDFLAYGTDIVAIKYALKGLKELEDKD